MDRYRSDDTDDSRYRQPHDASRRRLLSSFLKAGRVRSPSMERSFNHMVEQAAEDAKDTRDCAIDLLDEDHNDGKDKSNAPDDQLFPAPPKLAPPRRVRVAIFGDPRALENRKKKPRRHLILFIAFQFSQQYYNITLHGPRLSPDSGDEESRTLRIFETGGGTCYGPHGSHCRGGPPPSWVLPPWTRQSLGLGQAYIPGLPSHLVRIHSSSPLHYDPHPLVVLVVSIHLWVHNGASKMLCRRPGSWKTQLLLTLGH